MPIIWRKDRKRERYFIQEKEIKNTWRVMNYFKLFAKWEGRNDISH